MVHSARPLSTSRSSLASSGAMPARWTLTASGERKEHVLQSSRVLAAARAQLVERADATHATVGQQHEAVADPLRIDQLVNRKHERAPAAGKIAQYPHDRARLLEIEAVERPVPQQQGLRRDERERQHQSARVAL